MQDNNLLKFLLFSAIFTLGYMLFLSQFQEPAPKQNQQVNQPVEEVAEVKGEEQAQTEQDQVKSDEPDVATETEKPAQPETEIVENKFEENPHEILSLGTDDETSESGYYIQVNLSTTGAVVESVFMNDQRYKDLDDTEQSLQLLGNNLTKDRSFALSVGKIDDQLKEFGKTLHNVDWKVIKRGKDDAGLLNEVVFQFTSPDQKIRVEKRYALGHAEGENVNSSDARDTQNAGYLLDLTFKVYNLDDKPKLLQYTALGPAGVILENEKYATKFRDLKYKFEPEEGTAEESYIYAKTIADAGENQDSWTNPFDYMSVDVQYFTTVLMPKDERPFKQRMEKPWIAKSTPYILSVNAKDKNKSDISFMLTSRNMELDAGTSESHHFTVYLGPKRADLLEPLGASGVLEFWGWIAWLSKLLVGFLHLMNRSLGMPYWLAIISLTIIVRGCMHPLTRKQAASAKRMKELQPQLMELKKKYGNDREKMGQAQMQLFRDNNYNPFAGCLPLFLQMPIFIALYQGLRSSIDLRLAPFLWIENLAAPDMLFPLGFEIPLLGFSDFNLLPVLTVCLFLVQNKLFMPKPDPSDEQAVMQQKMMTYMMVFMGVLFYKVPAGLCVYFITSSLWGIGERKLLDFQKTPEPETAVAGADGKGPKTTIVTKADKVSQKKPGWFASWVSNTMEKVHKAAEAQQQLQREQEKKAGKNKKKRR